MEQNGSDYGWSGEAGFVSIPERVWWFVERVSTYGETHFFEFQSLKGFGGLWNPLRASQASTIAPFQSLKGFGGLWNNTLLPYVNRLKALGFNP